MGCIYVMYLTHIPGLWECLVSDPLGVLSDHPLSQQEHRYLPQPLSHMHPIHDYTGSGIKEKVIY